MSSARVIDAHRRASTANYGADVKSARVIDARNTSHGSGNSAYTYFVGDVLLETAKGPMVIELEFNTCR